MLFFVVVGASCIICGAVKGARCGRRRQIAAYAEREAAKQTLRQAQVQQTL